MNNTNESLRDSTKSTVSSEKDKPLSGDIIEDEDEDENEDVFGGLTFVKEGEEEEEEEEEEKSKKKKKPEKSKELILSCITSKLNESTPYLFIALYKGK